MPEILQNAANSTPKSFKYSLNPHSSSWKTLAIWLYYDTSSSSQRFKQLIHSEGYSRTWFGYITEAYSMKS
jgi:hypothetical protein